MNELTRLSKAPPTLLLNGGRPHKLRGQAKGDWAFTFVAAAYNLVRLRKLIGATT